MSKPYRTRTIVNADLNSKPFMYRDMSGKAYTGRANKGIDFTRDMLIKGKEINILRETQEIAPFTQGIVETVKHNLNTVPIIVGSFRLWLKSEKEEDALFEESIFPFNASAGSILGNIDKITTKNLDYSIVLFSTSEVYRVRLKFRLFKII